MSNISALIFKNELDQILKLMLINIIVQQDIVYK
jgi:hypothetical protein